MDNEQADELRKELTAVDDLLSRLLPEDDLLTLVTDERRRMPVATMVGVITLARDLLKQARKRLLPGPLKIATHTDGYVKKPRKHTVSLSVNGRGHGGKIADWILSELEDGPKLRNELAIAAMHNGLCTASTSAYGAFRKLIDMGKITLDEASNKVTLVAHK